MRWKQGLLFPKLICLFPRQMEVMVQRRLQDPRKRSEGGCRTPRKRSEEAARPPRKCSEGGPQDPQQVQPKEAARPPEGMSGEAQQPGGERPSAETGAAGFYRKVT